MGRSTGLSEFLMSHCKQVENAPSSLPTSTISQQRLPPDTGWEEGGGECEREGKESGWRGIIGRRMGE